MIHFAVSKALTEKTVFNSIRTERAAAAESGLRIGKLPPLPSRRALAHELGIGRTSLYRLLDTLQHKVKSTGGTRHTEWTVIED